MMMRHLHLSILSLLVGASMANAQALVNAIEHPSKIIAPGEQFFLDLTESFELYPVATFHLHMPVQDGRKQLYYDVETDGNGDLALIREGGRSTEMMTYKLLSGGSYDHAFQVTPEDFVWEERAIRFRLFPDIAPITVANFIDYATRNAYQNTIVHRSQLSSYHVLQAGGFVENLANDGFVIKEVEAKDPIPFERTLGNTIGTLGMARQTAYDTATSQFFFNLADNDYIGDQPIFSDEYTVFGTLLDFENDFPILMEMADVVVWNYGGTFANLPLYTPYEDNFNSFVDFDNVTIEEGNPEDVIYSWEFIDVDGEAGISASEAANQAAFDISINGNGLTVSRNDTGKTAIRVTATIGNASSSFETVLLGYNPDALTAFPDSNIFQGGWMESTWFGWLVGEAYPFIQHLNHGYLYVSSFSDENSPTPQFYLYDYRLGSYLYTTKDLYPLLYAYGLESWLYYWLGTGNGVNVSRWIYNYSTVTWFED